MISRVGSQALECRTERSDGLNPLGLRSGRFRKSRSLRRAGRVIPPNPTRPARSHYCHQETPQRSRKSPATSPIAPHPDGHAQVDNFFDWLTDKYPADKQRLLNAKDQLQDHDIDLATLQFMSNEQLGLWNISWGMAAKIKREIKEFPGARLQPVQPQEEEEEEDLYG